jgi:stage V sporulation protein B
MDTNAKKNNNFLVQGSILAIAGIVVRMIGLLYRIPMTNIIGEEGIGVYSTAYTIYNILLLISSYSLPVAVSRLVAARRGVGEYKNAGRVLTCALLFATISGTTMCAVAYFGSGYFARSVMGMPEAEYAIKTLAPTILVMAFLGTLRGYYQGHGTMIPTAVSQVIEQIVNAIVSVGAAWILFNKGMELDAGGSNYYQSAYGAAGGTIGTGMGALSAFIFCVILFFFFQKVAKQQIKQDTTRDSDLETYPALMKLIIFTIVPVLISTTVYQLSLIVDQSIFAKYVGSDYKSVWGIYSGKYNLLTNVPVAFASALASSIIPALSGAMARGDSEDARRKTAEAIRFNMLIAIPCAVGLGILARPLMCLLFSGANIEAGRMMMLGSSAVIFYSLSTITNSILQGTGNIWMPVRNAVLSLALHVGILAVLLWVFDLGIYGVVFANIAFALLMCIFNNLSVRHVVGHRQEYLKTFIMPLFCASIMGLAARIVYNLLSRFAKNAISAALAVIAAVIVYAVLLLFTRTVSEEELKGFPKGAVLVRAAKKLHLM